MKVEYVDIDGKRYKVFYRHWCVVQGCAYSTIHECLPGTNTGYKWLGRYNHFNVEDCVEMLRLRSGEEGNDVHTRGA